MGVDNFLLPQNEIKFNQIHKCFSPFPTKYRNVSEKMKKKLYGKKRSWLFFENVETQEMFAQNVNQIDEYGETALHRAANWNDVKIAKALIEAGAYVDVQDANGETALHYAAFHGHLEIGKVLVDAGADLKIRTDLEDATALDFAEGFDSEAFAEMLRKKMGK